MCYLVCALGFQIPKDIQEFDQYYIDSDLGCFIVVKDKGKIIGTVAYRKYDQRFDLGIAADAVEVVKLFVSSIPKIA